MVLVLFSGCAEKGLTVKVGSEPLTDHENSWTFLTPLVNNTIRIDKELYPVKLPASFADKKVAYGETFFGGGKEFKPANVMFFLVHFYDETSPVVVFDLNGNLDFADDSIFSIEWRKPFDVRYKDPVDDKAVAVNRFWLLDSAKEKGSVLYEMDSARKGQKPLPYFLGDQRLDFRKVILKDGNIITLWDGNFNGRFNDKVDKVIGGDISIDSYRLIRNNPMLTKSAQSKEVLVFPNNSYKLIGVDKYGASLTLKPLDTIMSTRETLPAFTYETTNDQHVKFDIDTSKKYSVLYFWGAWCVGCRQQSPYLVQLIDSLPSVCFFTFNYGDKKERMLSYLKDYSLPFQANKVDDKTVNSLFVTGYPTFIILNKKREVLLRTMNVGMVKQFLSKNPVK